jgi:hypothetical protein
MAALLSLSSPLITGYLYCCRYQLDYLAKWSFWRVSGLCTNRMLLLTDADEGTVSLLWLSVKVLLCCCTGSLTSSSVLALTHALRVQPIHAQVTFKLREPGFLKVCADCCL